MAQATALIKHNNGGGGGVNHSDNDTDSYTSKN